MGGFFHPLLVAAIKKIRTVDTLPASITLNINSRVMCRFKF